MLAPGINFRVGLGLYGSAPMVAFFLELSYGVLCWRIFRGSRALLAVIVGFNVANLSFFSAALPGPEELLANHPTALVLLVLVQIVVTLGLVLRLGRERWPPLAQAPAASSPASRGAAAQSSLAAPGHHV